MHKKKTIPLRSRVWLSSPTMHGEELKYVEEAYTTNWMSTVGENITQIERITCQLTGRKYAVALSSGTAALHLAVRMAAIQQYGVPDEGYGSLTGKKVFCSDVTFDASVNPVLYEGGEPVFIDSDRESWNMDPKALEKAFEFYPEVKIIVLVHLYGSIGKIDEIRKIAEEHQAVIVEDAAEALGAKFEGKPAGTFGEYSVFSYNGNKIITGSSGGIFLSDQKDSADKISKWSTQAREDAPWYQHEELGYNYRMSNVVAGVIRGQYPYLEEHIKRKKEIYERYQEGFAGLPVKMNPILAACQSNYWLSCLLINEDAMTMQVRRKTKASYTIEPGKSCPTEILNALKEINAEGRPIWKPMHMQPVYRNGRVVTADGMKGRTDDLRKSAQILSVGEDLFARGVCLPSDIKMTEEQQDRIIEEIKACFE